MNIIKLKQPTALKEITFHANCIFPIEHARLFVISFHTKKAVYAKTPNHIKWYCVLHFYIKPLIIIIIKS